MFVTKKKHNCQKSLKNTICALELHQGKSKSSTPHFSNKTKTVEHIKLINDDATQQNYNRQDVAMILTKVQITEISFY